MGLIVRCAQRAATFWIAPEVHTSDEGCVQRLSRDNVQILVLARLYVTISDAERSSDI